MANYYPGHTAGQSDNLFPDNKNVWDWRLSSINITKSLGVSKTLPGQPDTSSTGYGTEHIVDQVPPDETRTYTASCVNASMLNTLLGYCRSRNAYITITDRLGFSFSGRFVSLSAQENGSDVEASAFYSVSLQLRSGDAEVQGSTRQAYTVADS